MLERFRPYIRVVYDEGKGIGIARNIGVLASRGSYIYFVDADCTVGVDHFTRVFEAFERGADVVYVKASGSQTLTKIERLKELVWRYGRAYSEEMARWWCFAGGSFIAFKRGVFDG
ncbi:MAG: glycosyltransferase family A protein [Thermofilum sp.]